MKRIALCFSAAVALTSAMTVFAGSDDQAKLEQGKTLFQSGATPACAICHTLEDAGTTGAIGPDLDELKADLARIKQVLIEGMGAMPSFADTLSDEQRDAIAAYVVHATGADH